MAGGWLGVRAAPEAGFALRRGALDAAAVTPRSALSFGDSSGGSGGGALDCLDVSAGAGPVVVEAWALPQAAAVKGDDSGERGPRTNKANPPLYGCDVLFHKRTRAASDCATALVR